MYDLNETEVFKELKSNYNGLSDEESLKRLKENGKNKINEEKKISFLKRFFKQFLNIMVAILLVSSIISIAIAIINKAYSDLFEGFVILFIVIMNALIGVFQENKAEACLNELKKYSITCSKVKRNGSVVVVDSEDVVVGDVIEMEAGNIVPADIRLIHTNNFACDESSLTGESESVEKQAKAIINKKVPIGERINMAYAGSLITRGNAIGVVCATGKRTEMGKIASMLTSSKKEITPLQKSINKIGKIITIVVLVVCAIILTAEIVAGNSVVDALMVSVALAVAAIPESLPAVITIIMALGVQQLAKRKCIIKHLHAVESLGSCEIICSDKTGTLTMNKMNVVETFHLMANEDEMLKCMSFCNNAVVEKDMVIGEPTEKALKEYTLGKISGECKRVYEIPFNSDRKKMTVLVESAGVKSYTKGAFDRLINDCRFIKIGEQVVNLTEEIKNSIVRENDKMTDKALRVICLCCKEYTNSSSVELEKDLTFLGLAGIMDKPRPEVKESVKKCFKAGLKPIMITGDHKRTAFAIAKEIGIAKTAITINVTSTVAKNLLNPLILFIYQSPESTSIRV